MCGVSAEVLDKKQPFFLFSWPLSIFAKPKIYLEACFVTKTKFKYCLIGQLGELLLLLEGDSEANPKCKYTLNMGLHAPERSTPRLIRHYKVWFLFSVITSVYTDCSALHGEEREL